MKSLSKCMFTEYSLWNLSQSLFLNSSCNATRDVPQQDEPSCSWLPQEVKPAPVWCQPSWGETSVRRSSVTWRAERWGGGEEMRDRGRMRRKSKYSVGQMRPRAIVMPAAAAVVVVCACQDAICFHVSFESRLLSRLCKNIKLETVDLSNYLLDVFFI